MTLKEFTTKFRNDENVIFNHRGENYKGKVATVTLDKHNGEEIYHILSGGIIFKKREGEAIESLAEKEREEIFNWLQEPITEFKTKNDAEFAIFPDDEDPKNIRIEISPDYVWTKEDVCELVAELLKKVGAIDKEGNILDEADDELDLNADQMGTYVTKRLIFGDGTWIDLEVSVE